jgi:AbrB family looped-hinge helix DNA binding protein
MTKKEVELLTRIGPKGQIVLKKEIRKALGIREGTLLRTKLMDKKIIITPFDWDKEMKEVEKIAKEVGKKWPKGLTSVDVIKEQRE